MATRAGPSRLISTGRLAGLLFALIAWGDCAVAAPVEAGGYKAFWLWAGVKPQPAMNTAEELYILAGEVRGDRAPHIVAQRSATPRVKGQKVWIVYRAQTIAWDDTVTDHVMARIEAWRRAGSDIAGLQIDFDAGTRNLHHYAAFLSGIRSRLPDRYRLSVTGLLDWSANGDPTGLDALAGVVDEVVLQIYQGRRVIAGYQAYLAKLGRMRVPFRIGLLQGGDWQPPAALEGNSLFKGYVVFLLNEKS